MSRAATVVILLSVALTTPGWAGEVIFTDGWESGSPCSWASEFTACGVGTELVITLPGDAVTMTFMYIPPGTFWMGSPTDERGRVNQEDLHEVTLTHGFWLGKYEVTQAQWEAVMGSPPYLGCFGSPFGVGPSYPVYCLGWLDIAGPDGFISALNSQLWWSQFRLPTEAEWERAERAGTQARYSHGDALECIDFPCTGQWCATHDQYMWWCGNEQSPESTGQVGSKAPNAFGLHDMHGNVREAVQDWFEYYLFWDPVTDPTGPESGVIKVYRGGGWVDPASWCRSAARNAAGLNERRYDTGFRLAMTAD